MITEKYNNAIENYSDVTPIPTEYNGIVFRSRLESRWAKFFDIFYIPYEYESEGFKDGDKKYLPDFYLPTTWLRDFQQGVHLEIKPEGYDTLQDDYKWSVMLKKQFVVCFGNPPPYHHYSKTESSLQIYPWWDNCMKIMKCLDCGHTKIEFDEGNYKYCPNSTKNNRHELVDLTEYWLKFGIRPLFSDNRILKIPNMGWFDK